MGGHEKVSQLVVVGSSAGGIDALSTLLASLPSTLGAPVLIAQHLEPTRASLLAEILSRHTTFPVRTVEDREPLLSDVVYVVPASYDVEVTDHEVRLLKEKGQRPKPSVDLLFASAARVFREDCIAVVLSGMGSDGAEGARAVKAAGGTVIIQDPATAAHPGMPASLAPTLVDIVTTLERTGPLLAEIVRTEATSTALTEERLVRDLLARLRETGGIDFSSYKRPTILRRIQRRVVATRSRDLADYVRRASDDPAEYQRLISSFLINVTQFFRDREVFDHLRDVIVPRIIEDHSNDREIRLWSAGCATGEEAYSLAMTVAEVLGDSGYDYTVRIFATDIDPEAVDFARRGIYPASAVGMLPPATIDRYFTRLDGEYEVNKSIRSMIVFGQHDLGERAPFPRLDLVLCRNVLIYFTPSLQKRALQLFAFSLRDGGYLALGTAESTSAHPSFFIQEDPTLKVFRRTGDRAMYPLPVRSSSWAHSGTPVPPRAPTSRPFEGIGATSRVPDQRASERLDRVMLELPVGVIVVTQDYDIQAINPAARELLSIYEAGEGKDLVHLVKDASSGLIRGAIDAAATSGAGTAIVSVDSADHAAGSRRHLRLEARPYRRESTGTDRASVLLTLTDITFLVREAEATAADARAAAEEHARIVPMLDELALANQQLLEANRELGVAVGEQRSINEELMVSAEEVQAATEEVETLNEELQATNEELETLNEELQATVEELNTTNEDLQTRTAELQAAAAAVEKQRQSAEAERARLATILSSLGDAVLVVNGDGAPVMANAAYEEMFGSATARFQPLDEDGVPIPESGHPLVLASMGESFNLEFTLEGDDDTRRWFEATGAPLHDGGTADGGVIVVRDITERSLRHLQGEFISIASHELRTPLAALHGYLQVLVRQPAIQADPALVRFTANALDQTRRLADLVAQLVDATRLQTGKMRLQLSEVEIAELTREAVDAMSQIEPDAQYECHLGEKELIVSGDRGRIQQVILNLLRNAAQFAGSAGPISVHVEEADGEGMAEIRVSDRGGGIRSQDLPHIFSRFYQASTGARHAESGLGLGLYIARQIVEAHDGTIEAASPDGGGATFTVRLPLAPAPKPATSRRERGTRARSATSGK